MVGLPSIDTVVAVRNSTGSCCLTVSPRPHDGLELSGEPMDGAGQSRLVLWRGGL